MGVSTEGGILRRGPDRMIGGVCSGLAHYFQIDPVFIRVAFVAMAFLPPGVGFWLYLVLWVVMPPPQGAPQPGDFRGRLRMVSQEMRQDWRNWFSPASSSGPSGTPPPPETPPPPTSGGAPPVGPSPGPSHGSPNWWGPGYGHRPGAVWGGVILVAIGIYFLLLNLGYLTWWRWDIFWPIVLIALGLLVLARRMR